MEVKTLYPARITLFFHTLLGFALLLAGGLFLFITLHSKIWHHWMNEDHTLTELARIQARPHIHWSLRIKSAQHFHVLDIQSAVELPLFAGDELHLPSTWVKQEAVAGTRAKNDEESSLLLTHPHGLIRMLPNTRFKLLDSKECNLSLDFKEGALSFFLEPNKKPLCLNFGKHTYTLKSTHKPGWLRVESKEQNLLLFPRGLQLSQDDAPLEKEAYECDQGTCTPQQHSPSIWLPPSPQEENQPLVLKGPYPNARFISTTSMPIWVAIEVNKIPLGSRLELEMIRWDDPEFEPQTVPSRHGLLVPLRNGNYRYRLRLKHQEEGHSDWTPERQLSIQDYHYGARSAMPLKLDASEAPAPH
jgi:hypothetical protein